MNNLHAPTVPSGPTTARTTNGNSAQLSITELENKKINLEAELKALSGVLDSHGVDMNTPLLTPDGFPRADIDVAQIRTTRTRIIHLKNDYKDLMGLLEKRIHEHFASLDGGPDELSGSVAPVDIPRHSIPPTLTNPFAKVNSIVDGSPASQAGLRAGDEIRSFGYVDIANNDNLSRVAECVQGNEGQNVLVRVSRPNESSGRDEILLTLVPSRNWGGRGMLGCHILPI